MEIFRQTINMTSRKHRDCIVPPPPTGECPSVEIPKYNSIAHLEGLEEEASKKSWDDFAEFLTLYNDKSTRITRVV